MFTANPEEGLKPLKVVFTNTGVDLLNKLIPFTSSAGTIKNTSIAIVSSGGTLAFFKSEVQYEWDFGDNTNFFGKNPPPKTYQIPGYYTVVLKSITEEQTFYDEVIIKVLDKTLILLGSFADENKIELRYGNDNTQGFYWSTEGGEGHLWAETKASLISFFDNNKDWVDVLFDAEDGLPYCINPHESYQGSNLEDCWLNKYDKFLNFGYEIESVLKFAEFSGVEENYLCKLSDINLFYNPLNKGEEFRDLFKVTMNLYKNFELLSSATAQEVPKDRELYFKGRNEEANLFNLELIMSTSFYRLRNLNIKFTTYDKARFPFAKNHWERNPQYLFANMLSWIARPFKSGQLFDRVTGNLILINEADLVQGTSPDGLNQGFVNFIEFIVGYFDNIDENICTYWSNVKEPDYLFTMLGINYLYHTQYKAVQIGGETWYLYWAKFPAGANNFNLQKRAMPSLPSLYSMFDFRILNTKNITDEQLEYYFNDIINNKGNIFCPQIT